MIVFRVAVRQTKSYEWLGKGAMAMQVRTQCEHNGIHIVNLALHRSIARRKLAGSSNSLLALLLVCKLCCVADCNVIAPAR